MVIMQMLIFQLLEVEMNSLFLTTVVFLLASKGLHAQFPDGGEVLEQETKRMNELNELEHQVKIMEQKSRIIKAQKEIDKSQEKTIFVNLDSEGSVKESSESYRVHTKENSLTDHQSTERNDTVKLPVLISIDGNGFAGFQTSHGKVLAKKGEVIPGNFRVEQVSIDHGVIVSKSGHRYSLDMSW